MAGRVSVGGKEVELQQVIEDVHERLRELACENQSLKSRLAERDSAPNSSLGPDSKKFSLLSSVGVFTGDQSENVFAFFECLDEIAVISGWADTDKLRVARLRVSGGAAEFVRAKQECRDAASYEDFKKVFIERFKRKHDARFYRELVSQMKRGPTEDIEAFADRIRNANANTYERNRSQEFFEATLFEAEQRALDAFLNGLSGEVERRCRHDAPKTLDDAVRSALRAEAIEAKVASRAPPIPPKIFRAPNERKCFNCLQPGHFARECRLPRRNQCYACGKVGHIARECQRRGRSGPDLNGHGTGAAAGAGCL